MAATKKKRTKRRRGQERQAARKQSNSRFLNIGIVILVVGLLAFGTFQVFGNRHNQSATGSSAIQVSSGALESLDIESNRQANADTAAVPVTDRETRYLGPASDPATVSLAEAGQLGQPTLLWFHADW